MGRYPSTLHSNIAFFIALLATALAMGAALAHALELPNKIDMPQADYFVVQRIYDGWNQLAYLLSVEFTALVAIIIMHWRDPLVLRPTMVALGSLVLAQAVFWIFTFPANQATGNWTSQPANWEVLRSQWEYSHLAGAVAQVVAMAALIVAILRRRAPGEAVAA